MSDRLDAEMGFAREAINLRELRQKVLASNIANADTPGYQARDIDFSAQLTRALTRGRAAEPVLSLTLTAGQHIPGGGRAGRMQQGLYRVQDQPGAVGSTVDRNRERVQIADNRVRYQTDLTRLSDRIKQMVGVMQGG